MTYDYKFKSWKPSTLYHIVSCGVLLAVFFRVGRKYLRYLETDNRPSMRLLRTVILVSLLISSTSLTLRILYNVWLFLILNEVNQKNQTAETAIYLLLIVGSEVIPYCSHVGTFLYKRKKRR